MMHTHIAVQHPHHLSAELFLKLKLKLYLINKAPISL